MNPILSEGCDGRTCAPAGAATPARSPTHAHSITARVITHLPKSNCGNGDPARRAAPRLEEVAELEMQLPAGRRLAAAFQARKLLLSEGPRAERDQNGRAHV